MRGDWVMGLALRNKLMATLHGYKTWWSTELSRAGTSRRRNKILLLYIPMHNKLPVSEGVEWMAGARPPARPAPPPPARPPRPAPRAHFSDLAPALSQGMDDDAIFTDMEFTFLFESTTRRASTSIWETRSASSEPTTSRGSTPASSCCAGASGRAS